MFAWQGTILRVDLTKGEIVKQPLDEAFARRFLGGRGFNNKIIFDEFDPAIKDPYDPANIMCITPGVLGGTFSPSSSRMMVTTAVSPRQGFMTEGSVGGHFPAELKYAGYDGIVIKGAANSLVYLYIDNEQVELRDASHLAGKCVIETDALIREELKDTDIQTMVIGPAGENRVVGSLPIVDCLRAPGNSSAGAVWGAKKLKAIAVRGTKGVRVAKPEELINAYREIYQKNTRDIIFPKYAKEGSKWLIRGGQSYAHNVQDGVPFPWENLSSQVFMENFAVKSTACHACFTHCGHHWRIKEGKYAGVCGDVGEAGVIAPYGALPGITDYAAVLYLAEMGTNYGLDSICTALNIATAIHLWQDGLLTEKDTGGLVLEWGNVELVAKLLKMITYREGFGAVIADGHEGIAKYVANSTKIPIEEIKRKYVRYTRKGVPVNGDAKGRPGIMFSISRTTRRIDMISIDYGYAGLPIDREELLRINIEPEIVDELVKFNVWDRSTFKGKAYAQKYFDSIFFMCDCLGLCKRITSWEWMPFSLQGMAKCFSAATGIDCSWKDLYEDASRMVDLQQSMLIRQGIDRSYDALPAKYLEPLRREGLPDVTTDKDEFEKEVDSYYRLRGWDKRGVPKRATLEQVGLPDVADVLEREGFYREVREPAPDGVES